MFYLPFYGNFTACELSEFTVINSAIIGMVFFLGNNRQEANEKKSGFNQL